MKKYKWGIILVFVVLLFSACSQKKDAVEELLSSADDLYDEGRFEEALELYNQVIEKESRLSVAYNNRGLTYFQLEKYAEAEADFKQAISLDTKNEYFSNLGLASFMLKNYQEAVNAYSQAIENDSRNGALYVSRAQAYTELKQNGMAVSDYTQAIALGMTDATIYNNRGTAYFNMGEYSQAAADYTTALEKDPENTAFLYRNRAEAYRMNHDYDNAIADYEKIIDEAEDQETLYALIASMHMEEKHYEQAFTAYEKLHEINPEELSYLHQLADLSYYQLKQYSKAIEYYSLVLPKEPSAVGYGNRADCYLQLEDKEKALPDLDQAIELDPEYGWAYYTRGSIYMEMGEYELAEADFSKAQEYAYEGEAVNQEQ